MTNRTLSWAIQIAVLASVAGCAAVSDTSGDTPPEADEAVDAQEQQIAVLPESMARFHGAPDESDKLRSGPACEPKVCASVAIRSRNDVDENRECAEIRGDLTIAATGLSEIGPNDFPFLTTITGDLIISGVQTSDAPHLSSVTLARLREIRGALFVIGVAVIEAGGSGPLQELHLPALEHIGQHEGVGLVLLQASLKVLDVPSLEGIEGGAALDTLTNLCSVRMDRLEHAGRLTVNYVPKVPLAQLAPLREAAEDVRERALGCCAPDDAERVSCESFTDNARSLYCTGC